MDFGPLITADWLRDHLDEVQVFDSRSYMDGRSGYEAHSGGHIPRAVFVDLNADLSAPAAAPGTTGGRHPFPTAEAFACSLADLGYQVDVPAVIYDDVGGGIAARMWFMLHLVGAPAAVLDGGIGAWTGDLEWGPIVPPTTEVPVRPWPSHRLVSADDVAGRIASGGVVIDARSAPRYEGHENPIDDRFGHIPGAMSMPWEGNVDPESRVMRSVEALGDRFAVVVDSPSRVTAYCGSGVTACHDLLALELLGVEGDLYVGSWSEWGSDERRPVETGRRPSG